MGSQRGHASSSNEIAENENAYICQMNSCFPGCDGVRDILVRIRTTGLQIRIRIFSVSGFKDVNKK